MYMLILTLSMCIKKMIANTCLYSKKKLYNNNDSTVLSKFHQNVHFDDVMSSMETRQDEGIKPFDNP